MSIENPTINYVNAVFQSFLHTSISQIDDTFNKGYAKTNPNLLSKSLELKVNLYSHIFETLSAQEVEDIVKAIMESSQ